VSGVRARGDLEPDRPLSHRRAGDGRAAPPGRGTWNAFEAFPVDHSLRAPAVGYRITAGCAAIFYAPDLVSIVDEQEALSGLDL
jgi:hypothetical protein